VTQTGQTIGFIGVGVMGEPMCRNLKRESGANVIALDRDPAPLQRLAQDGVVVGRGIEDVVGPAAVVFLSLPSGEAVDDVVHSAAGILSCARAGQIIVDLGTTQVDLTRSLSREFAQRGVTFIDAPVARTRAAAEAGTLAVMVGADDKTFAAIRPLIATFASDITLCGPVGCGQVVKIMNNMVLFQTVVGLAEALCIARANGIDGKILFETLTKGSADSFGLRNHGMKAMLPGVFPLRAFSTNYALKDLSYAIQMAEEHGVPALGADVARELMERAKELGFEHEYWPVLIKAIEDGTGKG